VSNGAERPRAFVLGSEQRRQALAAQSRSAAGGMSCAYPRHAIRGIEHVDQRIVIAEQQLVA
jgi:hypothetical protein